MGGRDWIDGKVVVGDGWVWDGSEIVFQEVLFQIGLEVSVSPVIYYSNIDKTRG